MRRAKTDRLIPAAIAVALLLPALAAAQGGDPAGRELLGRVDAVLSPGGDFKMNVQVASRRRGRDDLISRFRLLAKGRQRTLLKTVAPEADRGRNILYLGREVWAYLPSVRRPFAVSLTQRLTGEVANGDIARSNLRRDYRVERELAPEAAGGVQCRKFSLKARAADVAYAGIVLWLEESSLRPVRADYFAESGRILKHVAFLDYQPMLGATRPTRLVLTDGIDPRRKSTIVYSDWRAEKIPAKFLTISYLDKAVY